MTESAEYITDAVEMMGAGYEHEPRKIVTEVSGFYPIFEAVLQDTGDHTTAAVHGVMWRFCQMEDGVCKAALDTIASALGISTATVMRRQSDLVDMGYFTDLTPDLKNRPHVYVDNQRVVMRNQLTAKPHFTEKRDISQRKASVSQSQLNKDSNKDFNKVVEKKPTSTSPYIKAEQLICKAADFPAIPYAFRDRLETVLQLLDAYDDDKVLTALMDARSAWIGRKRVNGSGNYSVLNPGWIDWAISHLAGETPWATGDAQEIDEAAHPEFKKWQPEKIKAAPPPKDFMKGRR